MKRAALLTLAVLALAPAAAPAYAQPTGQHLSTGQRLPIGSWEGTVRPADWAAYKARFLAPEGRIVDDGNGGISHSEGQGYGLLLAFSASDRAAFEQIWAFTRTELLVRDDGLVAWRWEPNATPHVTDVNDASDGDILVAYSLALAGAAWGERRYQAAAHRLAEAIGAAVIRPAAGAAVLMPAAEGFSAAERKDGPIVNPSYYVLEALPTLDRIAPEAGWDRLAAAALPLLEKARFGPALLPADWVSLAGDAPAAVAMPAAVFGYNAIRVPLYLARAGVLAHAAMDPYRVAWRTSGVAVVDLATGRAVASLDDPGYRMLPALIDCLVDGVRLPADLATFTPTLYYPSTLHLLALALVELQRPACR